MWEVCSLGLRSKGNRFEIGRNLPQATKRTMDDGRTFVPSKPFLPFFQVSKNTCSCEPRYLTGISGDMMQYLTNDYLPSTPHKVGLNTRERYAFAYFHEPNFSSILQPLPEYGTADKGIHYGTHFTNMFMRNYPERITAKRMRAENRMAILESPLVRSGQSACSRT
jgi:2OG-Fe(II) oxygenase superfamily